VREQRSVAARVTVSRGLGRADEGESENGRACAREKAVLSVLPFSSSRITTVFSFPTRTRMTEEDADMDEDDAALNIVSLSLFAVLECGLPAEVEKAELTFVNGTRRFGSLIRYDCHPGYVAVGRAVLMCDVDERWDGPPPRCEPVYCQEPPKIRHGGFSLSTNSTRFGTVASYYCTTGRHKVEGPPKLRCLADGSWDERAPACVEVNGKKKNDDTDDVNVRPRPGFPRLRRPYLTVRRDPDKNSPKFTSSDDGFSARPPASKPLAPVDNVIPDSANVQSDRGRQNADVPSSTSVREGAAKDGDRQAQLNLGKTTTSCGSNESMWSFTSRRWHYRVGCLRRLRLLGGHHHHHSHPDQKVRAMLAQYKYKYRACQE